jgi:hypothetical protein
MGISRFNSRARRSSRSAAACHVALPIRQGRPSPAQAAIQVLFSAAVRLLPLSPDVMAALVAGEVPSDAGPLTVWRSPRLHSHGRCSTECLICLPVRDEQLPGGPRRHPSSSYRPERPGPSSAYAIGSTCIRVRQAETRAGRYLRTTRRTRKPSQKCDAPEIYFLSPDVTLRRLQFSP